MSLSTLLNQLNVCINLTATFLIAFYFWFNCQLNLNDERQKWHLHFYLHLLGSGMNVHNIDHFVVNLIFNKYSGLNMKAARWTLHFSLFVLQLGQHQHRHCQKPFQQLQVGLFAVPGIKPTQKWPKQAPLKYYLPTNSTWQVKSGEKQLLFDYYLFACRRTIDG